MAAGSVAGHKTTRGYINIKVDQRMYKAHRLIFLYHYGYMPEIVDHIDCDPSNNRLENLRACDKSQNGMNRSGGYSATGHRNVYRHGGAYQVHMRKKGKQHFVGTFNSLEDAVHAANVHRKHLFGEFA